MNDANSAVRIPPVEERELTAEQQYELSIVNSWERGQFSFA